MKGKWSHYQATNGMLGALVVRVLYFSSFII